jgi:protein tyrosine/serine phosphatase
MKKLLILLLLSLIMISGCAYTDYATDRFKSIPAFYKVNDTLYRGGKPDMDGLTRLKNMGIKTIISLQQESDEVSNEEAMVHAFGMEFYNIPMTVDERPTDEQVLEFLDLTTNPNNFPIFVHCASGRDRTGAMIAMYRVVVESWTIKEAYEEAKSLGFWPYHGDAELKAFIHQLKDKDIYFIKVGRTPIGP